MAPGALLRPRRRCHVTSQCRCHLVEYFGIAWLNVTAIGALELRRGLHAGVPGLPVDCHLYGRGTGYMLGVDHVKHTVRRHLDLWTVTRNIDGDALARH